VLGFGFGVSAPSPCSDNFQKLSNVEGGEGWDEVKGKYSMASSP